MKRRLGKQGGEGLQRTLSSPMNLNLTLKQRMEMKLGRAIVCNGPPSPRNLDESAAKKVKRAVGTQDVASAPKPKERVHKDVLAFWNYVIDRDDQDSKAKKKKLKRQQKKPLAQLKKFAKFFNYERAWQDVQSQHRGELEAALESSRKEAQVFRQSVLDTRAKASKEAPKSPRAT